MERPERHSPIEATLMHLYRGELARSDTWRSRLDTTTNWSLTVSAAAVSYGFANAQGSHVVLLIGIWLVFTFLMIEARRYRYYDLFIRRVRLLEEGFWVPVIRNEPLDQDSMRELAVELSRPTLQLSLASAIATRVNRAYGAILGVLLLAWSERLYSRPAPPANLATYLERAHLGIVPGWLIWALVLGAYAVLTFTYALAQTRRPPVGELQGRSHRRGSFWDTFGDEELLSRPKRRRPGVSPSSSQAQA